MSGGDDIVEEYLDELFAALRGRPREVRRMLTETEDHLRSAIADDVARGLPEEQAAVAAVARYGRATEVSRLWNASTPPESLRSFVGRLANQLLPLAGVALVAVGLSGVAARIMTALWGRTFMFADAPGTTYPASACRYWLSIHPTAGTCVNAYLAESQADGLLARYAAGVVGLTLIAVVVLMRRRLGAPIVARPSASISFTGASVFLVGALGLLGLGIDSIRTADSHGAGQWLSGAVIALPMACVYGLTFPPIGPPLPRSVVVGRRPGNQ